jgi:ribosomal protein S18 acetylase RimI-like enzyme
MIAVDPDHQRRGIADQLVAHAVDGTLIRHYQAL